MTSSSGYNLNIKLQAKEVKSNAWKNTQKNIDRVGKSSLNLSKRFESNTTTSRAFTKQINILNRPTLTLGNTLKNVLSTNLKSSNDQFLKLNTQIKNAKSPIINVRTEYGKLASTLDTKTTKSVKTLSNTIDTKLVKSTGLLTNSYTNTTTANERLSTGFTSLTNLLNNRTQPSFVRFSSVLRKDTTVGANTLGKSINNGLLSPLKRLDPIVKTNNTNLTKTSSLLQTKVNPTLTKTGSLNNELVNTARTLGKTLQNNLINNLVKLIPNLTNISSETKDLNRDIGNVTNTVSKRLNPAVNTLTKAVRVLSTDGIEKLSKRAIRDLIESLGKLGIGYREVNQETDKTFEKVKTLESKAIRTASEAFNQDLTPAIRRFIKLGLNIVVPELGNFVDAILERFDPALRRAEKTIRSVLQPSIQNLVPLIKTKLIPAFLEFSGKTLFGIRKGLQSLGNTITTEVNPRIERLSFRIGNQLKDAFVSFGLKANTVINLLLKRDAPKVLDGLKTVIFKTRETTISFGVALVQLERIIEQAIRRIKETIRTLADLIKQSSSAAKIVNGLATAFNNILRSLIGFRKQTEQNQLAIDILNQEMNKNIDTLENYRINTEEIVKTTENLTKRFGTLGGEIKTNDEVFRKLESQIKRNNSEQRKTEQVVNKTINTFSDYFKQLNFVSDEYRDLITRTQNYESRQRNAIRPTKDLTTQLGLQLKEVEETNKQLSLFAVRINETNKPLSEKIQRLINYNTEIRKARVATTQLGIEFDKNAKTTTTLNRAVGLLGSGAKSTSTSVGNLTTRTKAFSESIRSNREEIEKNETVLRKNLEVYSRSNASVGTLTTRTKSFTETLRSSTKELTGASKQTNLFSNRLDDLNTSGKRADNSLDRLIKNTQNYSTRTRQLTLNLKNVDTELKKTTTSTFNFGNALSVVQTVLPIASAVLLIDRLKQVGLAALDAQIAIGKLNDQSGVSITTLDQFRRAAFRLGYDIGEVEGFMETFVERIQEAQLETGEGAEVFKELGITIRNSNGSFKDAETLIRDYTRAVTNLGNQQSAAAFNTRLLGGDGFKLGAVFSELSTVVGTTNVQLEENVKHSQDANRSWKDLQLSMQDLTGAAVNYFLPAATGIIRALNFMLSGINKMGPAIDQILKRAAPAIRLAQTLGQIAQLIQGTNQPSQPSLSRDDEFREGSGIAPGRLSASFLQGGSVEETKKDIKEVETARIASIDNVTRIEDQKYKELYDKRRKLDETFYTNTKKLAREYRDFLDQGDEGTSKNRERLQRELDGKLRKLDDGRYDAIIGNINRTTIHGLTEGIALIDKLNNHERTKAQKTQDAINFLRNESYAAAEAEYTRLADVEVAKAKEANDAIMAEQKRRTDALRDDLKEAISGLITGTQSWGEALNNIWRGVLNRIVDKIAGNAADSILNGFTQVTSSAQGGFNVLLGGLRSGFGGLLSWLGGAFQRVLGGIGNFIGSLFSRITGLGSSLRGISSGITSAFNRITQLRNAATTASQLARNVGAGGSALGGVLGPNAGGGFLTGGAGAVGSKAFSSTAAAGKALPPISAGAGASGIGSAVGLAGSAAVIGGLGFIISQAFKGPSEASRRRNANRQDLARRTITDVSQFTQLDLETLINSAQTNDFVVRTSISRSKKSVDSDERQRRINDGLRARLRNLNPTTRETALKFLESRGFYRPLQFGGIIPRTRGGQLSLIGEGRFNEAVVPLPNGRSIPIEFPKDYKPSTNNVTINTYIQRNGQIESSVSGNESNITQRMRDSIVEILINEQQPGGALAS